MKCLVKIINIIVKPIGSTQIATTPQKVLKATNITTVVMQTNSKTRRKTSRITRLGNAQDVIKATHPSSGLALVSIVRSPILIKRKVFIARGKVGNHTNIKGSNSNRHFAINTMFEHDQRHQTFNHQRTIKYHLSKIPCANHNGSSSTTRI
jgi:hypothetical protein